MMESAYGENGEKDLGSSILKEEEMKTKIWLALSALILTFLMAPPIMGMEQEKAKGEHQATKLELRKEHRNQISASRRAKREEYQATKNALISLRKEHRKEITAFRRSKREAA
jgi:hypothetical protein